MVGDIVEVEIEKPQDFGRIAAQTARQVIMQRINEAERDRQFDELAKREHDLISGVVQRIEPGRGVIVDIGKIEAILPPQEQAPGEHYRPGQRFKVLITEITKTPRGIQVTVSRTHKDLVKRLFELEVPEIYTGAVEIKDIAREPGVRSKVAVHARQDNVDPVGACVGQRGVRIQNVVNELNGEKIDVAQWHADPAALWRMPCGRPRSSALPSMSRTRSPRWWFPSGRSRWLSARMARMRGWPRG